MLPSPALWRAEGKTMEFRDDFAKKLHEIQDFFLKLDREEYIRYESLGLVELHNTVPDGSLFGSNVAQFEPGQDKKALYCAFTLYKYLLYLGIHTSAIPNEAVSEEEYANIEKALVTPLSITYEDNRGLTRVIGADIGLREGWEIWVDYKQTYFIKPHRKERPLGTVWARGVDKKVCALVVDGGKSGFYSAKVWNRENEADIPNWDDPGAIEGRREGRRISQFAFTNLDEAMNWCEQTMQNL